MRIRDVLDRLSRVDADVPGSISARRTGTSMTMRGGGCAPR